MRPITAACACHPQGAHSLPQRSSPSSTADEWPPPLHAHRATALHRAKTGAVGNGLRAADRSHWLPMPFGNVDGVVVLGSAAVPP